MKFHVSLPPTPHFDIEILENRPTEEPGFLRRVSQLCQLRGLGRAFGDPFVYDQVYRAALDAVVIVPHLRRVDNKGQSVDWVILRSAARPPVLLRDAERSPVDEPKNRGLWEWPAGLVEPHEEGESGLRCAARRELLEETGFRVRDKFLFPLGPSTFPAPGVIAERHFYFRAMVSLDERETPSLDGSALEEAGEVVAVPLSVAMDAMRRGQLADAKTELGLRRLCDELPRGESKGELV